MSTTSRECLDRYRGLGSWQTTKA